jgi:hypothetical protein
VKQVKEGGNLKKKRKGEREEGERKMKEETMARKKEGPWLASASNWGVTKAAASWKDGRKEGR